MNIPQSIEDLEKYIKLEIAESIHLDYKASPALSKKKRDEICKDVSSFANSDGGMLIYGIIEEDALPTALDMGVESSSIESSSISREWIEQIINTNISPTIQDIEITEIPKSTTSSYFAIKIPKSINAPHQAPDKKYYKRYNFMSSPMEHYEIEDVKNRKIIVPPLVDFNVELYGHLIKLVVENIGDQVATDVHFDFNEGFKWYRGEIPNAFKKGIKFLPPRRKIAFTIGTSFTILGEKSEHPSSFDVEISYIHPQIDCRYTEDIHIDLNDFLGCSIPPNELKDIAKHLEEISKFKNNINTISNVLTILARISGASGLDLSLTSLRNLKHIYEREGNLEPINLKNCDFQIIAEYFGISNTLAMDIYEWIHYNHNNQALENIEGITQDLKMQIEQHMK
jgi:hypothetical protein